jgi:hypothetical protein
MSRVALVLTTALVGCSSPDLVGPVCVGRAEQPLVNATTNETYLGISEAQRRAVVQITSGSEPDDPLCSGVFVAPEWVVTATHCLVMPSPYVVAVANDGEPVVVSVVDIVAHPSVDVALLRVRTPDGSAFESFRITNTDDPAIGVGDVVALAGYGVTETGESRELRFLAEPVVAVEPDDILVSGLGESGACFGDSGGPLLVRDSSGAVVVLGVLTSGSASCLERDRYVRLDTIRTWLTDVTGSPEPVSAECGGIDAQGRCLYGTALFCDAGTLVAESCGGESACGWSRKDSGFRCVEQGDDPCHGVDSAGACRDGIPSWCVDGRLVQRACDCSEDCTVDGRTGGPRCEESSEL